MLKSLTVSDVVTKAALSFQLFEDPECWSGWGLNPGPLAQLPTELACWQYVIEAVFETCAWISAISNYWDEVDQNIKIFQ